MLNSLCRRGFNLVEIAIVLGVIGLMMGSVYVAASAISETRKTSQITAQFNMIVNNLRKYYWFQASMGGDPAPATLMSKGVLPSDVQIIAVSGTDTIMSPFGKILISDVDSLTPNAFNIGFYNVPPGPCIKFLSSIIGNPQMASVLHACGYAVNNDGVSLDVNSFAAKCNAAGNRIDVCLYLR